MARRMIGLSIVGALLLAPGLSPAASRCDTKITIYSGTEVATYGGVPALACAARATDVDGRLIYGDHITLAYPGPYLRGRPFLLVTLNGLGFRREIVPLVWDPEMTPPRYISSITPIPWGAEGSGCLKANLTLTQRRGRRTVTILRDATTYHTLNARC